jgi:epoxyqueuosine reductase
LDANKCISYHTIENRELAPLELREKFGDWVYGCDICQQVCPWNRKNEAVVSAEPQLWTRDLPGVEEWTSLPQEEFSRRLKGSPIKRAKKRGMRRNAARALRNRKK